MVRWKSNSRLPLTRLVRDVASVAAHVQCGVAAALLWNISALVMACEAEIVLLLARGRLQQLELVFGSMRVVAGQAIANRRLVHTALDLRGIFIAVAGQADFVGDDGDELYAGDISVDPDFMTAQTAHRNSGVDGLAFRLVSVALEALGAVGLRIERNGVNGGGGARNQQRDQREENQDINSKDATTVVCDLLAESMGE